jgi:hypothetical protein
MARSDGTVYIDTLVDTKGFQKGMNAIEKQTGNMASTFGKLGKVIAATFAISKIVQFGKKAIELGSDLQEVQNVVDVTFTTMSDKVDEFAKAAAESAGLSETMAKRYTGTFGAMAKAFGFAESEAFNMSTSLTQLAGDVASFYNLTQDEAYTKLKSVFTGETESLKDLGVVMTQSALDSFALAEGLGKTTKQMSEQEKVALRYRFVMNQLSTASGDFLRTSDSWANQTRLLKLNLESIMATFGQGLINFFTPVIKLINTLLSKIATLANAFKAFSEMIMGTSSGGGSSGAGQAASAVGELADGYNDATEGAENLADATEKANKANKKYLSGLDEIKTFQSETEGTGDISTGGISGQPIDFGTVNTEGEKTNTIFDGLIEKAKELAEIFKEGFFDGFGDFQPRLDSIKNSLASIKESLIDIFTDSKVLASANVFFESFVYMLGQVIGSVASIGLTIGANLLGGFEIYLNENKKRIKQYLISMFDIGTDINILIGDLFASIAYIFEAFASEEGQQLTSDFIGIFTEMFMGITELGGKFSRDVIELFAKPIIDSKNQIKEALIDLMAGFSEITEFIKKKVADIRDFFNQVYDEFFTPMFDNLTQKMTELVRDHLSPMLSELGDFFRAVGQALMVIWQEKFKPFIQWIIDNILPVILPIINGIVDALMGAVESISDLISGLMKILTGLIDFLVGSFTRDWVKAWEGVKGIFKGIINSISSILEGFINAAIDLINGLIGSVNSITSSIGMPNIPTIPNLNIPKLATGAVIPPNAPFMAVLGDQRHGTNIEAPLDTIKQAVREVVGNGNGGVLHAHLYLDGKEVLTSIIDMAKLEQTATGINPLLLT